VEHCSQSLELQRIPVIAAFKRHLETELIQLSCAHI